MNITSMPATSIPAARSFYAPLANQRIAVIDAKSRKVVVRFSKAAGGDARNGQRRPTWRSKPDEIGR